MPVFDTQSRRVVVRVVYDGPAQAGKTTNMQQLCRLFTSLRRGELRSFEERAGRTLYFDWLHLDGGLVGGHPLRCQLVSVPGQAVLSQRRRHLLSKADAVVFVCESTRAGLDMSRRMIESLFDGGVARVPLVVQANKQDLPGVLSPAELARELALPAQVPVVGARAHEGTGVREALVLAIRAAANAVQRELIERGLDGLLGAVESCESLYQALREDDEREATRPDPLGRVLALVDGTAVAAQPEAAWPVEVAAEPSAWPGEPPLPTESLPAGLVWPAATGRAVLRELLGLTPVRRGDLVGRHGRADGSGTSDSFILEAGGLCLKTSARRAHASLEEGRTALVQLARRKTLLGGLLPPRTVLCLQPDPAGRHWLWTITPWLTTLRTWMERAEAEGDAESLTAALTTYAEAAVMTLEAAGGTGLLLDVHPSNFARADGRVVYLDDDIAAGERHLALGHALLRRVDEYSTWPAAVEGYLSALEYALRGRLSREALRRADLGNSLAGAHVHTTAARDAQERLLVALEAAVADAV